ncbi:hypothetical protein FDF50_14735 [Clostridium botulinum]|uniref:Uncharacterized protein n=1 Tax=Clostridium botulinum TaxID=1491 RepID=A0A6G4HNR4_CLOBO|nr:hypothetical protein [Clostridium botulinum]AUM88280.1 hypothetical protein RSJ15_11435 [Clostridium botulinum]MBD5587630.1 hypothetical protein [Clostridium botulinum]MBN3397138.1 hypothetical protein [Clostridium botulinum]MBO0571013.1 hypothetical protein [Clostridium botulinum]MBY6795204.1 hypothetical protein [Clostridium botulinum]
MKRGSLIIYDNTGKIFLNTGDAEGDLLPHTSPVGLPYIITKFGELDGKIVKGVNVKTKELILEDRPHIETEEEKLKREKQELENQLLLQADNNLDGGIL